MSDGGRSGRCTSRQDWEHAWRILPGRLAWTHTDRNLLRLLREFLIDARRGLLLETGSGSGHVSLRLAGSRHSCVLVDYVLRALRIGRSESLAAGVEAAFVAADMGALPFPDGMFDLTWNAGVLQTIAPGEQRVLLKEMKRVTRPGGWVVAVVPRTDGELYRRRRRRLEKRGQWPYGGFESPSAEIHTSFDGAGFEVVRVRVFGPLDGLAEVRVIGRLMSFVLNRTPFSGPLETLAEAVLPGRGYWSLLAGRRETE